MKLKKILFPFNTKRPNLDRFVWHRLLTVLYFLSILPFLIFTWISIINYEFSPIQSCIDSEFILSGPYDISHCWGLAKIHHSIDFLIALIITVTTSYLIQIIYYEIILYIFLGKVEY